MTRRHPHHHEAEQSVLGAVLLEATAFERADLDADDFYDPRHREIWSALGALREAQVPVDPVTLETELKKRGNLVAVGDLSYVSELMSAVPTADNVEVYAGYVRDTALARRTIVALSEVIAKGMEGTEGPELVTLAAQAIDGVLKRTPDGTVTMPLALREALADLDEAAKRKAEGQPALWGVPTGFVDLDALLGGWPVGVLSLLAARPSMGKAQPLDAHVLTPRGFRRMGDLAVGDAVIGAHGRTCRVIGIVPQGQREIFQVRMTDGATTRCCDEHLWLTRSRSEVRRGLAATVKPLAAIRTAIRIADGHYNHRMPIVAPVHFGDEPPLPLHPYALGALLGDGSFTSGNVKFCKPEADVQARLIESLPLEDEAHVTSGRRGMLSIKRRKRGREVSETKKILGSFGLFGRSSLDKYIPPVYLTASLESRTELLQGLMDTHGYVEPSGRNIEFATSSPQLRDDVTFLVRSLGGLVGHATRIPKFRTTSGEKKAGARSYRLYISFPEARILPVSSAKHRARWRPGEAHEQYRSIETVESLGPQPCQCITVDAPDGLYVTDDFIVTHNSSLIRQSADAIALRGDGAHSFTLEDTRRMLALRELSSEAGVPLERLRALEISQGEMRDISRAAAAIMNTRGLWLVDDSAALTVQQIRLRVRKHQKPNRTRAVFVDYATLVAPPEQTLRATPEHQLRTVVQGLQTLARQESIAVVLVSQLNRECEDRDDKRPILRDLRGSGALEESADVVIFLYRDEVYDDESKDKGICEAIVAKNKHGQTGTVRLAWHGKTTSFRDLARRD